MNRTLKRILYPKYKKSIKSIRRSERIENKLFMTGYNIYDIIEEDYYLNLRTRAFNDDRALFSNITMKKRLTISKLKQSEQGKSLLNYLNRGN